MSGIKGGIKRCFLKSEGSTINSTIDITLYIITGAQFCLATWKVEEYAYNLIQVHHFQNQ